MKLILEILYVALTSLFLIFAMPASAQVPGSIKVHLSADSRFGMSVLPAGDYWIHALETRGAEPILAVENDTGLHTLAPAVIDTNAAEPWSRTEVVLAHNGSNILRVSQIRIAGTSITYLLVP
jgi:hypothetical protein